MTGEARRIDHAVIENGRVRYLVETTSKTADKSKQMAKEARIRANGGTFIRDKATGALLDVSNVPTRITRRSSLVATNDILIDCVKVHLAASKNLGYRDRVRQRFKVFVGFIQSNGLATRQILTDDAPVPDDLEIRKSDLTDEGFELVKTAYDKWLGGLDRGRDISDVSTLNKSLSKIREKGTCPGEMGTKGRT